MNERNVSSSMLIVTAYIAIVLSIVVGSIATVLWWLKTAVFGG